MTKRNNQRKETHVSLTINARDGPLNPDPSRGIRAFCPYGRDGGSHDMVIFVTSRFVRHTCPGDSYYSDLLVNIQRRCLVHKTNS